MWDHDWGWGNWLAMSLMMLLLWGGVIGLVVRVIRSTTTHNTRTPPPRRAEDVLADRFAGGEIDEVEFRQRLAVLRGEHPERSTGQAQPRSGTAR